MKINEFAKHNMKSCYNCIHYRKINPLYNAMKCYKYDDNRSGLRAELGCDDFEDKCERLVNVDEIK